MELACCSSAILCLNSSGKATLLSSLTTPLVLTLTAGGG